MLAAWYFGGTDGVDLCASVVRSTLSIHPHSLLTSTHVSYGTSSADDFPVLPPPALVAITAWLDGATDPMHLVALSLPPPELHAGRSSHPHNLVNGQAAAF
jgi:hypothetical protein